MGCWPWGGRRRRRRWLELASEIGGNGQPLASMKTFDLLGGFTGSEAFTGSAFVEVTVEVADLQIEFAVNSVQDQLLQVRTGLVDSGLVCLWNEILPAVTCITVFDVGFKQLENSKRLPLGEYCGQAQSVLS